MTLFILCSTSCAILLHGETFNPFISLPEGKGYIFTSDDRQGGHDRALITNYHGMRMGWKKNKKRSCRVQQGIESICGVNQIKCKNIEV